MDSYRCINRQLIREDDTFLWISRGNLKAETERWSNSSTRAAYQNKYYATTKYNQNR